MIISEDLRLIFVCDACGEPVTGDAGWLHISTQTVRRVEAAAAAWHQRNTGPLTRASAYADFPAPAAWKVHHAACDPGGDSYTIHVNRCDTWPKLVSWTAHLMGKSWLEHTDWRQTLERLTADIST